jgi:hypothetical protein
MLEIIHINNILYFINLNKTLYCKLYEGNRRDLFFYLKREGAEEVRYQKY